MTTDAPDPISRCKGCWCMTKTIKGRCGKCHAEKPRRGKPRSPKKISVTPQGKLRKHFEANMLDGDTIQGGQMISSKEVFEYLEEYVSDLLTQVGEEVILKPLVSTTAEPLNRELIKVVENELKTKQHQRLEAFRERVL